MPLLLSIAVGVSLFSGLIFAEQIQPILQPPSYVSGHILVKISPHQKQHSFTPVLKAMGAQKIKEFSLVDGLNLYQFDEKLDVFKVAQAFMESGAVEYAEPDYVVSLGNTKPLAINDPDYGKQWSLENKGQNGGVVDADINAESAWAIETGKKGIVIGIIDTGVDYGHQDLADNMWKNGLEIPGNGKDDDNNGYIDDVYGINAIKKDGNPMDDHLHGTHVAGIIGAKANNQIGISGVVQVVDMAACKFLSSAGLGSVSDAITCMDYFAALKSRAQNPVNIVATNNSWGGGAKSKAMFDAIKAHEQLGILFVAAAGNQASNNDVVESYPSNYKVSNLIAVAATDSSDRIAPFSNYGKKTVHVAAPGSKILSTLPNNKYGELSGTSMAAPHVSGLIALIASHFPELPGPAIKNLILAGGQKTNAADSTTIAGRRIRGADAQGVGSLSCLDQVITIREQPIVSSMTINTGDSIFLSARSFICAQQSSSLRVWQHDNDIIDLNDEGKDGDIDAHDGVFSLNWTPQNAGVYIMQFSDTDTVSVTVIQKQEQK